MLTVPMEETAELSLLVYLKH